VKIFGSTVHGLDTPTSDIDFLVSLSNRASSFALAGFQIEAEKMLKLPVDVMLEATDSHICERARAEAVPL
jgi:predicted nucleotidyltransferase